MDASLALLLRIGVEAVWEHTQRLTAMMIDPLAARTAMCWRVLAPPDDRGPYACVAARKPDMTAQLFERLRTAQVFVSFAGRGTEDISPPLQFGTRYRSPVDSACRLTGSTR